VELEPLRDKVVKELTRHCGDGRLTLDELETRIEEAYAAETEDDLRDLLADLPPSDLPAVAPPPPSPSPSSLPPPTPRPPTTTEPHVGMPDAAKLISTACTIGGFVLLFNGMVLWAIVVWFVVPGLLIHDRMR
jgi:hypothetical protein